MAHTRKVALLVDDSGDICGVCDAASGDSIFYDVQRVQKTSTELNDCVSVTFLPNSVEPRVQRALNFACTHGGAAYVIPLPHCAFDGRTLRGCVYAMPADGAPCSTGFPLDLRYATGLSMVELERRLPNGSYMSAEFVRSPEFMARHTAAVAALRQGRGTPPGLLSPGTRAVECLRTATSSEYSADPLLRTFRPDPLRTWQPHLRSHDFIRVCSSQWETTHPRTASAFGHAPGDTHITVVLCYHLPEEITDQLMQIACMNPDGQTWAQIAARDEFARALQLSIKVREHILRRYMELTAMEPKQSDKRFGHTTADVLVADVDTLAGRLPVFYSGCTPTHDRHDGVLGMSRSNPDAPIYWWAGPQESDHPGGGPWEMPDVMHAMPVVGAGLRWNKSTLALMAEAGHDIGNGYTKMVPIV